MNPRTRLIAVVAAGVVINLIFFFFFIRGRQSELSDADSAIEAAETETIQLRAQLAQLRELQRNAPDLEARLADIRELVPRDDDVASFIFLVQEAADEAGVGFVQISPELPKPPLEAAALAQVRTIIRAQGGYFSLQDFIRRIYDLDRAVRIDNLTLSQPDEAGAGSTLELNATARIFFELPTTPPLPPPEVGAPVPPPSPVASPSPPPAP